MPPLIDFITDIYCLVDDHVKEINSHHQLRKRGFQPKLSDAEVITMQVVGEFLEIDTDNKIWKYFKHHWLSCFPPIGSRSQFAKQAVNLWAVTQSLLHKLLRRVQKKQIHIVDGFPIPVSHFKRANGCQRFKGDASYGYCASKSEKYYGFKGHLWVDHEGEIAGFTLTAAHESEREALFELVENKTGLLLGDKGYLGQEIKDALAKQGVILETPVRSNMQDPLSQGIRTPLNRARRRIETTIGQLATQFNIEKTWARNKWSLTNRLVRKLLSHSLGVLLNRKAGREPLQLEKVI